jgi:hypothetical protein
MPQLVITPEQCQQLLSMLRAKFADDISVPAVTNDHQDHLFSEMVGNNSFCCFSSFTQSHKLEDKHSIFSSNSIFQLAIKNSTDRIVCFV